jgi:hypothetical protein
METSLLRITKLPTTRPNPIVPLIAHWRDITTRDIKISSEDRGGEFRKVPLIFLNEQVSKWSIHQDKI